MRLRIANAGEFEQGRHTAPTVGGQHAGHLGVEAFLAHAQIGIANERSASQRNKTGVRQKMGR